ncbi:MAG: hypothetical protein WCG13_18620 [Burkholderiales bacterium]
MAFTVRMVLSPAGAWRVGSVGCALTGLFGISLWGWSSWAAGASLAWPVWGACTGIALLGAHGVVRARRAAQSGGSLLHIDPLGGAHLTGRGGTDPLIPLAGHRNPLLVALERADHPRGGAARWLSVRQPRSDSDRAALGAWLVWLSRGAR